MRFGPVAVTQAEGAILAHSLALPGRQLKKGRVLTATDLDALAAAGLAEIVAARLDPDDVPEDQAAARAARGLGGTGVAAEPAFTGRVNLHATSAGLLLVDAAAIDALNALHESVTLATLSVFTLVRPGQMVATVKVIPLAAPESIVTAWQASPPVLSVASFRAHAVALVQTMLPSIKASVLDKTARVTRERVEALGSRLVGERRTPHREDEAAAAIRAALGEGATLLLVAGASAIIDRRDVVPAAIVAAGGEILQFGMPVDPGNLLLLGRIGEVPVLGMPGCARSPKLNGFDWVLERLVAGLPVGAAEIARMGVGGLLAEIPSRGLPREAASRAPVSRTGAPRIAALVLAAGRSTRMGTNKLLIEIDGRSLVERAVDAALSSRAVGVTVVVGYEAAAVRARLGDRKLSVVENPDYALGLSTSLKAGLAGLSDDVDAVVVCLGDMPGVDAALIDRMIAAFNPAEGREIVVPVRAGRRGNPVLWSRRFLPELLKVTGDAGAKHLIGENAESVAEIECADDAPLVDLDTPAALADYQTSLSR